MMNLALKTRNFVFKMMNFAGVEMSASDVKATMLEIDSDENDEISYEEMIEWLMKKDLWDPEEAWAP